MNRGQISKSSVDINAPVSKVWGSLVNPEIAKMYFFGAEIISDWKEGSPITFKENLMVINTWRKESY